MSWGSPRILSPRGTGSGGICALLQPIHWPRAYRSHPTCGPIVPLGWVPLNPGVTMSNMLLVLTSTTAIAPSGEPRPDVVAALLEARRVHKAVGVISNRLQPLWHEQAFGSQLQFVQQPGRQNGKIVRINAEKFSLSAYDTVVLAATQDDIQMAKNGGAVLIAAGWSPEHAVRATGIPVASPADFVEVLNLISSWSGAWWYQGAGHRYSALALSNLSSYNAPHPQVVFAEELKVLVKGGGPRLVALLTVASRSMLMSGFGSTDNLMWGVFPSSASSNDDTEVLSEFTHGLRTTVSRVRYARRGAPLFLRHRPSAKRSAGGGGDRTDPSEQLETMHLNPAYEGKIQGRNVVVVDDCTTYGVSFGVAAALLRVAGAATVTGVALGKFGRQLRYYEIDIEDSPFAPIKPGGYRVIRNEPFNGTENPIAQNSLRGLL